MATAAGHNGAAGWPATPSTAGPLIAAGASGLIAVLVAAQAGLYLWTAWRGIDLTDESYYFLNYLHWREFEATVTFFGAYFEFPFRWLGSSPGAIRVVSLAALLVTGAFFTTQAVRFVQWNEGRAASPSWTWPAAGMAAATYYFAFFGSLRAPSYNLLALCCALLATGLLLQVVRTTARRPVRLAMMLAYGLAIGACGMAKATSAAAIVVCHALFLLTVPTAWHRRWLLPLVIFGALGVGANLLFLQLLHPGWLGALQQGVAMTTVTDGRAVPMLINTLRWDLQRLAAAVWPAVALAGAATAGALLLLRAAPRLAITGLALAACLVTAAVLALRELRPFWWPVLVFSSLALTVAAAVYRTPPRLAGGDGRFFALLALLWALPLALSFGTTLPVLEHSQHNAVFAIAALLVTLLRLQQGGLLAAPAVTLCLAALCVPSLAVQVAATTQADATYRLNQALGEQRQNIQVGAARAALYVDAPTARNLQQLQAAAQAAGWRAGDTVIDFTGDGPGLVFVLGGRPLGLAWLLGGYPGSTAVAARLLQTSAPDRLRDAWLLSSTNNPRRVAGWQALLDARLAGRAHELAATVQVEPAYRWSSDAPAQLDVQIWRPANKAQRAS